MKPSSKSLASLSSKVYCGFCPDIRCQTKLVFPSYESSIECTSCGQRHEQKSLRELQEVTDPNGKIHNILHNVFLNKSGLKRGAEAVKVLGLSNYHCKLMSPILTRYGMDKRTGCAKLLSEMNQDELFDCGVLGDRCFRIDSEHVEIVGYGRDISGSRAYLATTLAAIKVYNENEERLLPIHADGDGHCLVHAVSRALVGRELFWHALRTNLKNHIVTNLYRYKCLFSDFIDSSEWCDIIQECDTDFEPPSGELLGLRNIHVFGLANVLKRPIILLDSLSGMQSSGDYAATFLPALIEPKLCRGKSGELNKPLCIAWSSNGHNHYIPLVGIKNKPLPRLPRSLVPKAWGLPQDLMNNYIDFDGDDFCVIGGEKCLQDSYLLRLTSAMEEVFISKYNVHPALVADVHHYIYKRTGVVGAKPKDVLDATQKAVQEKRLYICLSCDALSEQDLLSENFKRGGAYYVSAEQKYGKLSADKLYPFPLLGTVCAYNAETDELVPNDKDTILGKCSWCLSSQIRLVNGDGTIQYRNGDRTKTRSHNNQCKCGFKHYWDNKEYDGQPKLLPIVLEWGPKVIKEKVTWFQNESDPLLNSNVYTVASSLVQKHFPGVFGSERLVQKVVDQILEQTKQPDDGLHAGNLKDENITKEDCPSKIIISGIGTVHKEELTMSNVERSVRQRIRENAPMQQRRRSLERVPSSVQSSEGGHSKSVRSTSLELKTLPATAPTSPHKTLISEKMSTPISILNTQQRTSKMVRVVTSDGRQLRIILDGPLTYAVFFKKLEEELNIGSSLIKKIMYGFPPRELPLPQSPDSESSTLPFLSGDRISVEIIHEVDQDLDTINDSIQSIDDNLDVLSKPRDSKNSNSEKLDTSVTSLLLAAVLTNQNIWTYVQSMPDLFKAGGMLYRQVKRDIGLADGKHCRLPILPDKVFRYSAEHDRLELCLEPYGHFPVEPGVEEKILRKKQSTDAIGTKASVEDDDASLKDTEMASTSGVVISKSQQILASHVPFHGHGYSLRDSSNQPSTSSVSHEALRLDEHKKYNSLDKFDEQMETDNDVQSTTNDNLEVPNPLPALIRKGPGYSTINPEITNLYNSHTERLKTLASQIAFAVLPDEEKEDIDSLASNDSSTT